MQNSRQQAEEYGDRRGRCDEREGTSSGGGNDDVDDEEDTKNEATEGLGKDAMPGVAQNVAVFEGKRSKGWRKARPRWPRNRPRSFRVGGFGVGW